jgi:signal transduction histidine kinase
VAVSAADDQATLTVADEGCGMGEEVLARAFEPFYTTRPDRALGLGLSTARAIVERHGGRITLESRPGEGTIATVVLPAIP